MKTTIGIMGLIILVVVYFLFVTFSSNKKLKDEIAINEIKTDSIKKSKYIEVAKPFNVYLKPDKVIQYLPDPTNKNRYDSLKLAYKQILLLSNTTGTSIITNTVHDTLRIANSFLLQYPEANKLISFELSKSRMVLQMLRIDGIPVANIYDLNLDNYQYRFSDNNMTTKRIGQFHLYPSLNYSYRILNNLHDLDLDLNIKTTNFIYKAGANTFYYPGWDKLGYDIKLSVQYNL